MTNNPKSQSGSRLLGLPSEVRLLIYERMFPPEELDVYAVRGNLHRTMQQQYTAGKYVAALATCRMIYNEGKPILYANSEFHIHIQDDYANHPSNAKSLSRLSWSTNHGWLGDLRSALTINQIQKLAIDIALHARPEGMQQTWTGQLRSELRGARQSKRLHITLKAPHDGRGHDQLETDRTLYTIGQTMKCSGIVTAAMDLSLGGLPNFVSESYYDMLAGLKGIDRTHEVFSKKLDYLSKSYDFQIHRLRHQTTMLTTRTQSRIKAAENAHTRKTDTEAGDTLAINIQICLKEISGVEKNLVRLEDEIATLKQQLESLTRGNKTTDQAP